MKLNINTKGVKDSNTKSTVVNLNFASSNNTQSNVKTLNTSNIKHNSFTQIKTFPIGIKIFLILIPTLILAIIPWINKHVAVLANNTIESLNFTISAQSLETLTYKSTPELKKDKNGFTNVLLVGIDTRSTDITQGLKNTDTIILASYNHNAHKLAFLSFPRDIYTPPPDGNWATKINAIYYYGEHRKEGNGLPYLQKEIEMITGLKIQYYAMINLAGFKKAIDILGGVDVYVDRSFTDYRYPAGPGRYKTVKFTKGWTHMDGEKALEYARSRHGTNGEASDFMRARRQQKIIQAVIKKVSSSDTLLDVTKVYNILKTLSKSIKISQVTPEDIQAGINILKEKGVPKMYSQVLDPAAGNYTLMQRGHTTLYTIVPKAGIGNYSKVKIYVKDYVWAPELITKNPTIYVYNASDPSYWTHYSNARSRFFYLRFKSAGTTKATFSYVSNPGGKDYKDAAKYVAKKLGLKFVEYNKENNTDPKVPTKGKIVIVFAK